MHTEPLSNAAACSERSLWLLITHCASCNLKKQVSLLLIFFFFFSFYCCRAVHFHLSGTPLTTVYNSIYSMKRTKEHLDHTYGPEMVWVASLLLFNPPFPWLFWTTQLSLPDMVLYCKKHIIREHAPFVYVWGFVRAHVCLCVPFSQSRHGAETEGGEFDICKLNSAQTWQWWSVVHSSRDCLYLRSCLWVLQQACPLHRPQPQHQLAHLLMTVLENQIHTRYMFYQLELAGEGVGVCVSRCVFFSPSVSPCKIRCP